MSNFKDTFNELNYPIESFVVELMSLASYFHLEHFAEKSGFKHERLQVIYEALPEWADRISEYWDSQEKPLNYLALKINICYMPPQGINKYLTVIAKIREKIKKLNEKYKDAIGFQNILGDMEEKLGQQYYALSKIS